MTISFDADKELGQKLKKWWEQLKDQKGDRAELCRAENINTVILLPAFHRACRDLRPFFENEKNWELRLAAIIGLSAHVRENVEPKLALAMAGKPEPQVSELRFRRLIQNDRDDLYVPMVRVIRQLGKKANLYDLANSVYYWGDKVKRDWAFTYFPNTQDKSSA